MAGSAPAPRLRVSIRERDRIAARLREACVDERLSVETFIGRLDSAYSAQSRSELSQLVADLRRPGRLGSLVLDAVGATSRWTAQLTAAWREPRIPRLTLPAEGEVVVGRSRSCDWVVMDSVVSRWHARLRCVDGRWLVRDCESMNGTYLNRSRISSEVEARPGDELTLGDVRMILCAPAHHE